ncbi:hybrid sensor histidine kinase/response regulator transcription factor [Flavilitoribacter nigricans]|nr:two-component regulator propeller domain-containing protein [Flavilitoribacter nigricans]
MISILNAGRLVVKRSIPENREQSEFPLHHSRLLFLPDWEGVSYACRGLILLGFMVFCVSSFSQSSLFTQHKFHRLNEEQGLINNVVNDIIQDTLGQVWVATNEGLFRYQGFEFQKFIKNKSNPDQLHNNFIERLYLDESNNLWLMTDDGVGRYSYETDVIRRYLPDQLKGRVSSMAIDADGVLYFGKHGNNGIVKVLNDSVYYLDLYDERSGIDFGESSITEMVLGGDHLWAVAAGRGVFCYNLRDQSITYFSAQEIVGKPYVNSFDLLVEDQNTVWLGTESSVYALHLDHNSSKRIERTLADLLPDDDYLTIYLDDKQNLWLGSRQNGMFMLSKGAGGEYELINHFSPGFDEYSISHRTISKIYQQKNGYFWLGTHNGGVNIFNPEGEIVRMITKQASDSEYSLNYQNVWGIYEAHDGRIWVGTDGKGISLLDPRTGKIQNNAIRELENKAVLSVLEDSQQRVWIGTYAHGIYLYDPADGQLIQFTKDTPNSELLVNDIRCFYEDKDGSIYIGTNRGGLYSYDPDTQMIRLEQGVSPSDIRSIASVEQGVLWLGTFGDGLQKYNVLQKRVIHSAWSEDPIHAKDVVYDIHNDSGRFWVGTRHNGLVVFDVPTEQFIEMPVLDDLLDRLLSGVQMDGDQNLWINTNTGIVLFDRKKNELREFGAEDGFQIGHFNNGSIFYSRRGGYMANGGIHGLNLFYPDELRTETKKTRIILNQLKVFDKVVTPENSNIFPQDQSIFLTKEIQLDYSDNIFSIQYALPGFSMHSKKDFVYMLEDYEQQWQYGAESNLASYRNVPPGQYLFRVKNSQDDSEASLAIIINPPIWKTWQAYIIYTLIIAFLIWKWNKFSNSRIALKQKLQFEQELREKEQLIMQEKLRFYTNFSHELKTPLTLIQGPVNDLLRTVADKQQQQYLRLIRKNTGIILKFIRRMLEFRKIELSKSVLNVGKHDLKILAQEEAESFGYLAKEKEIRFGFYCVSELEAWVDLEKIQIVINNLLSNAFKFTPKGRSVNFGVYEEGDDLVIEVKDEGLGIRKDELTNIFTPFFQASNSYSAGGTGIGLTLCKSIVELHLGTIDLQSREGKGTRVLVRIPKDRAKFGDKEYVRYIYADEKELILTSEFGGLDETNVAPNDNEKMLLLVDDNKDITAYIRTLFEKEFKILIADNGDDAYELAVNSTPDLIISDMMMPGMDGQEFCRKIKGTMSTSHIPVIMLTAKDNKKDKISSYAVGVDDYITKPFASDLLIARVNNLLKSREMLELHYETNELVDPESDQNPREVEFVLQTEAVILRMLEQAEFDIPMLCKELGMSQSALYRKVKSLTGLSIQIFIKKIRIKRAAQLLLSEDMAVSEIAFSLNFSDLKYFRKCFKEQFKMTPSEYKANHCSRSGDVKIELDSIK